MYSLNRAKVALKLKKKRSKVRLNSLNRAKVALKSG